MHILSTAFNVFTTASLLSVLTGAAMAPIIPPPSNAPRTATPVATRNATAALTKRHGADRTESSYSHDSYATVYHQHGVAGSCGDYHHDGDYVCAMGHAWMGGRYNAPSCGRKIEITNVGCDYEGVNGVGNSIIVTVKDTCASCAKNHIDLSVGAWDALTNCSPWGIFRARW